MDTSCLLQSSRCNFRKSCILQKMWWKYSNRNCHFLPTNGYKDEESDHVLVVDMHFHSEEIFADSATKKMDTTIIHVVLAWIVTYTWLPDTATPSLSWMVD